MKVLIVASLGLVLAGCVSGNSCVSLPGHTYKTEPGCKRHEPLGKFDPSCDCPSKGYKGFSPPTPCL